MALRNLFSQMATEETSKDSVGLLTRIVALLSSPRGYDKSISRHKGSVIVETGTIGNVSGVGTVSNLTNIGTGRDAAQMVVNPISRTSWALNHRSRIS